MQCLRNVYRLGQIALIVVVACCPLTATGEDLIKHKPIEQSIPDVEWDAVFSRTEGWTGGDVAGTIDLGDGRTVWVFGDSWIGKVSGGKHAPGSHMINNAIGVQHSSSLGRARAPRYDEIKFFWGPLNKKKKPTAWIIPQTQAENRWYWASGGGVVIPGPNRQSRLIVFLFLITKRGEQDSTWNFKQIGTAMAIIDNAQEPAEKWNVRQLAIPYTIGEDQANRNSAVRETNWGVCAFLRTQRNESGTNTYLYIYGIYDAQSTNKQLMLARVPAVDFEKLDHWRFYAGQGRWSSRMCDAVHITDNMASELSIDEYIENTRSTFLMVHSEQLLGRRIMVRSAPNPEGPWSEPKSVYTVPGLDRGKDYFTYSAKGHLYLSRKNELLVTYIINANNFWDMAADAVIYRPRFIRVPLDHVLPQNTHAVNSFK